MNLESELTASVFEILRSAVNLARHEQLRSVAALRSRLGHMFPGSDADVETALHFWRQSLKTKEVEPLCQR